MNLMLLGAIAMACFTASLYFVRFWKTTRDRFFLYFGISFGIEGSSRILVGVIDSSEQEPLLYLIRLVSFLIILWAIIEKNWLKNHPHL